MPGEANEERWRVNKLPAPVLRMAPSPESRCPWVVEPTRMHSLPCGAEMVPPSPSHVALNEPWWAPFRPFLYPREHVQVAGAAPEASWLIVSLLRRALARLLTLQVIWGWNDEV